jgi:predicted phosphoribosyltransferase
VIVVDDGLATGATMTAALKAVRLKKPHELIAAVPVASPERFEEILAWCDEGVCVLCTPALRSVGQFYLDFTQVEDEDVVALLRAFHASRRDGPARKTG